MKFKFFIIFSAIISVFLTACTGDMDTDIVKQIQPTDDKITIDTDTFHIGAETIKVDSVLSKPDSLFLLGKFKDDYYGSTQADILTQFYYKEGYSHFAPSIAKTTADSAILTLAFVGNRYFGSATSPLEIKIYELKNDLKPNGYTNIDPAQYVDFTKLCGGTDETQTVALTDIDTKTGLRTMRIKLSADFVQRFFNLTNDNTIFKSQENFAKLFKGLYITSGSFGSATLINLKRIELNLYCKYVYVDASKGSGTTTLTFPVTQEVTTTNRIRHLDRNNDLLAKTDTNYICSPSSYYTRLKIPIGRMAKRIQTPGKKLVFNSSYLRINVANRDSLGTQKTYLPYVNTVLLVKDELKDDFFKNNSLPDNVSSFLTTLTPEPISSTSYRFYYPFKGLEKLIEQEIKKYNDAKARGETPAEEIKMVLIPINRAVNSSGAITKVTPSYNMEAAAMYGGKNPKVPMKMEIVFSGF